MSEIRNTRPPVVSRGELGQSDARRKANGSPLHFSQSRTQAYHGHFKLDFLSVYAP